MFSHFPTPIIPRANQELQVPHVGSLPSLETLLNKPEVCLIPRLDDPMMFLAPTKFIYIPDFATSSQHYQSQDLQSLQGTESADFSGDCVSTSQSNLYISEEFDQKPSSFSLDSFSMLESKASSPGTQKPKSKKFPWSEVEEKILKEIAIKYKLDWKRIAKRMFNLTNKNYPINFLKIRYKRSVSTDILPARAKFSHEEDLQLVKFLGCYGKDWVKIAERLPRRSPIMVKNRYYSHINKKDLLQKLTEELEHLEFQELKTTFEGAPTAQPSSASAPFYNRIVEFSKLEENDTYLFLSFGSFEDDLRSTIGS
jgi:hypothetical protein